MDVVVEEGVGGVCGSGCIYIHGCGMQYSVDGGWRGSVGGIIEKRERKEGERRERGERDCMRTTLTTVYFKERHF